MGSCCGRAEPCEIEQAPTVLAPFAITSNNVVEVAATIALQAKQEQPFTFSVKQLIKQNESEQIALVDEQYIQQAGCSIAEQITKLSGNAAFEQKEEAEIVCTLLANEKNVLFAEVQRISELDVPELWFALALLLGADGNRLEAIDSLFETSAKQTLQEYVDAALAQHGVEQLMMRKYFSFKFVKLDSDEEIMNNLLQYCVAKEFKPDRFVYLLIQLKDRQKCHAEFENRFICAMRQDFCTFLRLKFDQLNAAALKLLFDMLTNRDRALLNMLCGMLDVTPEQSADDPDAVHTDFKFDLELLLAYTHLFRHEINLKNEFPEFKDMLLQHVKGQNYRYILDLWGFE